MRKKFIYRKLEFNKKIYYQLYKIVNANEKIEVTDNLPGKNVSEFYKEAECSDDVNLDDLLHTLYVYDSDNDEIDFVKDSILNTKLNDLYYEKFKDFDLIPKNNFDVSKLKKIINSEILFQEKAVKELLGVLKSNLDIFDSQLSNNQKHRLMHNVIIYGPKGFGKKTVVDKICENINVPTAFLRLTTDPKINFQMLLSQLGLSSDYNMRKIENGIVFIDDNFDELQRDLYDGQTEINPFLVLEELLANWRAELGGEISLSVDLSKLTYVLIKNTATNNANNLIDEGLTDNLMDRFETIICFERLSKDQIKEIILNDPNNVFNLYKNICEKNGKKLIISDNFLDNLIYRAYYDNGGLALMYGYIETMIKTQWGEDEIVLDRDLVVSMVQDSSHLENMMQDSEDEDLDTDEDIPKKSNVNNLNENKTKIVEKQDDGKFKIELAKARDEYRNLLTSLLGYIKGQTEPLKSILYHVYINDKVQNSNLLPSQKKERINHLLIRGGAGTGKSYIAGMIAKAFNNKPFAEIDCKRYTESGYVGKSIDDMLVNLYYAAGCNLEEAQKGILFLDEIDKLARQKESGNDISRGSVQESLLKLMEGTVFDLEIKDGGYAKIINFDTRELTIICAGAFEGLDKIRNTRLERSNSRKPKTIGFAISDEASKDEKYVDPNYTLEDMQEFGMDAQLLRRINFHCDLNQLTKDTYRDIMLNAKSSAFLIKVERMEMLGIKVVYDDEFIDAFVERVCKLGFGASSIAILTEKIFSSFESNIMLENYEKVVLTKECVIDPSKVILVREEVKVLKKQK